MKKSPEQLNSENDHLVNEWAPDVLVRRSEEYQTDGMMRTAIIAIARARQSRNAAEVAKAENQAMQDERSGT